MNNLISIKNENGKQLVSARELHEFLESGQDFTTWIKSRIEKFDFIENADFTLHKFMEGKAWKHEYAITLSMAKELSMVENNEKGKEARKYFIECESQIHQPLQIDSKFLFQMASQLQEKENQIQLLAPKAEFYDDVAGSKDAIEMAHVSKVLAMKGYGRNNLFEFLRETKILDRNNIPYQKYVDLSYFRVLEQKFVTPSGETKINIKTLVYQKGLDFIRKQIKGVS